MGKVKVYINGLSDGAPDLCPVERHPVPLLGPRHAACEPHRLGPVHRFAST